MSNKLIRGITLIEILVVLVIISILSTIAVGVYSKEVLRARYARARAEIRTLEVAIARYEVDTGQYPPSGIGTSLTNIPVGGQANGSGYLQVALRSSLSANPNAPLSLRWLGPYIDWDMNRLANLNGIPITQLANPISPAEVSFLDPFGKPYLYIRHQDYASRGGTRIPTSPSDPGFRPGLQQFAQNETFFNPTTYQIISFGANETTFNAPFRGLDFDDVTNFYAPDI